MAPTGAKSRITNHEETLPQPQPWPQKHPQSRLRPQKHYPKSVIQSQITKSLDGALYQEIHVVC